MNGLDWVLAGTGILTTARGLWRGAVSQIFGLAGVIGGFLVASEFHETVGAQLAAALPKLSPSQARIAGFIALYLLAWFCVAVAGFWISRLLRRTGLGFLDRLWGALIGAGKALLLSIIALAVLTVLLTPSHPLIAGSRLAPYVHEARKFIMKVAPERMQTFFKNPEKELKPYLPDPGREPGNSGAIKERNKEAQEWQRL